MKQIFEFRIDDKYYNKLFKISEGKLIKDSVFIVKITKEDNRFLKIGDLQEQYEKKDDCFFYSWDVSYIYDKKELEYASFFWVTPKKTFEPTGEECGTIYDESQVCKICGSEAPQIGSLILNEKKIPKLDFSKTIGGEYIVSRNFVDVFTENQFTGCSFSPVKNQKGHDTNFYQIKQNSPLLTLSEQTLAGLSPFDFSEKSDIEGQFYIEGADYYLDIKKEVYKCPLGHTLGLNLVSLPYIYDTLELNNYDFFITKQKFGVRRGLLRPEPLYIFSKRLRELIIKKKMSGFSFNIINIVSQ